MNRLPHIAVIFAAVLLVAADKKPEKDKEPAPSAAQIQQWLKQFGDDDIKVREEGLRNLLKVRRVDIDKRQQEQFWAAFYPKFIISGKVVDESNKPIKNVTLHIMKFRPLNIYAGTAEHDRSKRELIDAAFSLEVEAYFGIRLRFEKKGFYTPEELTFTAWNKEELRLSIEGKKPPRKRIVKHTDLHIVLEKKGEFTHLRSRCPTLEERLDGTVTAANLNQLGWPDRYLIDPAPLSNPKKLPLNCVFVTAKRKEDGTIHYKTLQRGKEGAKSTLLMPTTVTLRVNDPKGGFILFKPKPNRRAMRQMKIAPEKGYVSRLELTAEQLQEQPYFYFKSRDRFGKGQVRSVHMVWKRKLLMVVIDIKYQPKPIRNLEDGR